MQFNDEIERREAVAKITRNVLDTAPADFLIGKSTREKLENQANLLELQAQALRDIAGDVSDDL